MGKNHRERCQKEKTSAVLMNLRHVVRETLHLVDLVCARLKTNMMTGNGTFCRTVTFTLDSGAAVSEAPKLLGDSCLVQIVEPISCKTATGEPVRDAGSRVLPTVTEEGLHRCMNFRVATKRWCQRQKCATKEYRIIKDSRPGRSGKFHTRTGEWIVLREEKGVHVFRLLDFSGTDSWQKEIEGPQFDAV